MVSGVFLNVLPYSESSGLHLWAVYWSGFGHCPMLGNLLTELWFASLWDVCIYVHKWEVQSSVLLYCARGFNPHVCAYQPPVDEGSTVWSKVPILGFSFWNTTFVPPSWAGASSAAGATGMYFCPLNIRWQQSPFCCWCYLDSSDHFPCGFLFHFPYRNSKWRIACTKWNCPMGPLQAALTNCCLVCVPGCAVHSLSAKPK